MRMKRRYWYLASIVLFVPLILWYAGQFSDVPELTFQQAGLEEDHTKRVMVSGKALSGAADAAEFFFMTDESGTKERVVYEGEEEIPFDQLASSGEVSVVGHMCSDGDGPCFKAKQILLSD